jgi:hypothetical protein
MLLLARHATWKLAVLAALEDKTNRFSWQCGIPIYNSQREKSRFIEAANCSLRNRTSTRADGTSFFKRAELARMRWGVLFTTWFRGRGTTRGHPMHGTLPAGWVPQTLGPTCQRCKKQFVRASSKTWSDLRGCWMPCTARSLESPNFFLGPDWLNRAYYIFWETKWWIYIK